MLNLTPTSWHIINTIRSLGGASRSDLVKQTDVSLSSIYRLTDELIAKNIIIDEKNNKSDSSEQEDSSKTKQKSESDLLKLNSNFCYFLGIGVDHSYTRLQLIDFNFNPVDLEIDRIKTEQGIANILTSIEKLFEKFCNSDKIDKSKVQAIGFSWPGAVSYQDGIIRLSPALDVKNLRLDDIIMHLYKKSDFENAKIIVEHDAKCAVIAEKMVGNVNYSMRPEKNIACMLLGKGVGMGYIIEDKLFRGFNNYTGEIGHLIIDESEESECACGKKGCLEHKIVQVLGNVINDLELITDPNLVDHEALGKLIGTGISYTVNLFNPELIVLSGKIAEAFPLFYKHMRKTIEDKCWEYGTEKLKIEKSRLSDVVPVGAAISAYNSLTSF